MPEKLDTIEYWYVGTKEKQRVRFHKFVHFFLLRYQSGDIGKHDWELNEALLDRYSRGKTIALLQK